MTTFYKIIIINFLIFLMIGPLFLKFQLFFFYFFNFHENTALIFFDKSVFLNFSFNLNLLIFPYPPRGNFLK